RHDELFPAVEHHVGEILQEQHGERVVLVVGGIDRAAEGIAGSPYGVGNLLGVVLGLAHWWTAPLATWRAMALFSCDLVSRRSVMSRDSRTARVWKSATRRWI